MASVQPLRARSVPRRIPSQGDLRGLRESLAGSPPRKPRRGRAARRWVPSRRVIAAVLLFLLLAPVAGAFGGANDFRSGSATTGCQLVSVVDGNTVDLLCPGHPRAAYDVMGLRSPPVLQARCLAEAWWGVRAQIALRTALWRAQALTFITEPRANLVLVFVDGQPLHRRIATAPPDPCT